MSGARVLVVDDDVAMQGVLSALISSKGHSVVETIADGALVMAAVERHQPDIVCLDYELPGRNGLELLRDIQSRFPEIDVIFITASQDESVQNKAADAGASGFIRKPFAHKQVIDELDQVHQTRRQAQAAMPAEEPAAATARPAGQFNPRATVVVDDNAAIRFLLKGLLSSVGLQVTHLATNGRDAIDAAARHQPGILCLDVDMPIMSGLEALPVIREVSPKTAVIMVTGNASRDFVQAAISGGARGYIIKPVRPAHLEAVVKKLMLEVAQTRSPA